jgi:hypothetical protein
MNRAKEIGVSDEELYRRRFDSTAKLVDGIIEALHGAELESAPSSVAHEAGEEAHPASTNSPTPIPEKSPTTTGAQPAVDSRGPAAPKQKRNLLSCCFVRPRSAESASDRA